MAEALGLAASVISIASLAIQLADSLRIACEFWESIEDGPDDIRRISMELRLLANILYHIRREHEAGIQDRVQEQMIKDALTIAKNDIDELAKIVTDLSRKIRPDQTSLKRKWGLIQVVLKGGKITKLKGCIESAKSNLNLVQSIRVYSSMAQMNGKLDLFAGSFISVSHTQPEIEVKRVTYETESISTEPFQQIQEKSTDQDLSIKVYNKNTTTTLNANLVKFSIRSTSSRIMDDDEDDDESLAVTPRTTYVVNMAWKFLSCRRGLQFTTNNNFDSWTFNTIRRRPADSKIFRFCRMGNTRGVQKLLHSGEASLSDVGDEGETMLHYACYHGHPELARFLISKGADACQEDDFGKTPVDLLQLFDKAQGRISQLPISEILNCLISETSFDPFEWEDDLLKGGTCALYNGLPYETIRSLFTESFAPTIQRYELIYDNLFALDHLFDNALKTLDFLLTRYESLRNDDATCSEWPFADTLLQLTISGWLNSNNKTRNWWEVRIARALDLTSDLYWVDSAGTPLDGITKICGDLVPSWLRLLSKNGVDLEKYVAYEQSKHPDGIITTQYPCCRIVHVEFQLGSATEGKPDIKLTNVCDPRFEHLDPKYRCRPYARRENCISQIDPVFIGEDGKEIPPLPGSWKPALKPNDELDLVWRNDSAD